MSYWIWSSILGIAGYIFMPHGPIWRRVLSGVLIALGGAIMQSRSQR